MSEYNEIERQVIREALDGLQDSEAINIEQAINLLTALNVTVVTDDELGADWPVALRAPIVAKDAEIARLEHEIEEWKTASGLEVGGDPMGVTPAMLEKRVSQDDRFRVEQELIYNLIYSSPMLVGDDRAIDSTSSMVRNYITAADAKIQRLKSALASRGGGWIDEDGLVELVKQNHNLADFDDIEIAAIEQILRAAIRTWNLECVSRVGKVDAGIVERVLYNNSCDQRQTESDSYFEIPCSEFGRIAADLNAALPEATEPTPDED